MKKICNILPLLALLIPLTSCQYAENDYYKILILSQGDKFSGYYIQDSDDPVFFTDSDFVSNTASKTYYIKKNLETPTTITIAVTGYSSNSVATTTSIDVYVYENNEIVKSETSSVTYTGDIPSIMLTYTFDSGSSS